MRGEFVNIGDGKIVNLKTFERLVASCPNGRYFISIEDKNKHTDNQRSYYWAAIVPAVKVWLLEQGFNEYRTNQQAHEYLKYKHNPVFVPDPETGEQVRWPGSTKRMTKQRYREYIDDILMDMAQKGVYIPEPENSEDKYAA